jgi:hypothetical protein
MKRHLCMLSGVMVAAATTSETRAQWLEDDCEALVEVTGTQDGNLFGDLVVDVGDVTDDGVPDFAVAAPFFNTNQGRVSVHSGVDGDEIWGHSTGLTSTILGFALDTCGDLDGDGAREVIASAPFASNTWGFVFVFSGADGEILHQYQGQQGDSIGYSIATGGDFNGDGIEDIAIGDGSNDDIGPNAGRVNIYSTADFSLITQVHPPEPSHWRFGTGIAFLGDVNGDGRDDLVIAERFDQSDPPGRLHVFSFNGVSLSLEHTIGPVNLGCVLCGDNVDGGRDVDGDGIGDIVIGESLPDSRARVFAGDDGELIMTLDQHGADEAVLVDDVDGDGLAEILVGDELFDDGAEDAGRVLLHSGADGSILWTMTSTLAGSRFGHGVAPFGDADGDGADDILVGAWSGIGRAYVMKVTPGPNPADITGDGSVNVLDLALLIGNWGPCITCDDCVGDIDGDCEVGVLDLVALINAWG